MVIKFCNHCDGATEIQADGNTLKFFCNNCKNTMIGTAEDTEVYTENFDDAIIKSHFMQKFIENAHVGPNRREEKTCKECGINYMTAVRVDAMLMFVCSCGYRTIA